MKERKLKRVVIKEELIWLTGNVTRALALNQLMYWSDRVKDAHKLIEEERRRQETPEYYAVPDHGWIYKATEELIDEIMLDISPATMRRHLKALVEQGLIWERNNPKYRWDHTKQYRVNFIEIYKRLQAGGYPLEGYCMIDDPNFQNEKSNFHGEGTIPEITYSLSDLQNEKSKKQNEKPNFQNEKSRVTPSEATRVAKADKDIEEMLENS